MAQPFDLVIGIKHGDTCTCKPLDQVTATAQPVIVNRDCPGQHERPRHDTLYGRITITWPQPTGLATPGFRVSIADADTGEEWTADVLNLRVTVDPRGITTATLERLVDADGKPIGHGKAVPTEDGDSYRSALFRYAVAEMRIADPS